MKRCRKCGLIKPEGEFYRRGSGFMAGKLLARCKGCISEDARDFIFRKKNNLPSRLKPSPFIGNGRRICCSCKEDKELTEFFKSTLSGVGAMCKKCATASSKKHMRDMPLDKKRAYYRKSLLKKKFSMTVEKYQEMSDAQKGVCAICGKPEPLKRHLAVDHDHYRKVIRGLLCFMCNAHLGRLEKNWHKIKSYLVKHGSCPETPEASFEDTIDWDGDRE